MHKFVASGVVFEKTKGVRSKKNVHAQVPGYTLECIYYRSLEKHRVIRCSLKIHEVYGVHPRILFTTFLVLHNFNCIFY